MSTTDRWWAMTCAACGGFVPVRVAEGSNGVIERPTGSASCVRCHATNRLTSAPLFLIDAQRLRRIKASDPVRHTPGS